MARRLTEKRVRDLKANPGGTAFEWDVQIPGFGIRTTPKGTKAFVLWTRDGTKKRLVTLGRVDQISLDSARKAAVGELDQIDRGGADLLTRRAEHKAAPSVADGCRWFLETHVPRRQALRKMSVRTAKDYQQQIRRYIGPAIGHLKIEAVERQHVEAMLDKIGASKPIQYARVRSLVRSMFNIFMAEGWRAEGSNPARRITVPTERPRERILSADEQGSFLAALARLGEAPATLAIRMLYETGARLSEIRLLRWDYVDADAKLLRLPESKTGPKTITLTAESLDVLARCREIHGNDFVFAGRGGNLPVGERAVRAAFHKVARMASIDDVRIHDLRRTAIVDALESRRCNHASCPSRRSFDHRNDSAIRAPRR